MPTHTFTPREMRPSDSAAVSHLITDSDGDLTTHFLIDAYAAITAGTDERTLGVVAECDGIDGLVGMGAVRFGQVRYNGDVLPFVGLDGLKVWAPFRGQGLGRRLAAWRVQCVICTGMVRDNHASRAVARTWCRDFIEPVPARREHEYVRHGAVAVLAAFAVKTGCVQALVRPRHRSREFLALLRLLDRTVPQGQVIHLILDPVRLHCSAEVAVFVSDRPGRFQFHWLPVHASWLSFIEAWFAILSKKCLHRWEVADGRAAEQTITDFVTTYTTHHAKPFTWRNGIRFYQRLTDKLADLQPQSMRLPEAA